MLVIAQPAGASVLLNPTVAVQLRNETDDAVSAVEAGTAVHELVSVLGVGGNPTPTGNVHIDWFTNPDCTGAPAATSDELPLSSGAIDATAFSQSPTAGKYAFEAHYDGDAFYNTGTGLCQYLTVVDARITIAANETSEVSTQRSFTVTVRQDKGNGKGLVTVANGTKPTVTLTATNGATVQLQSDTCAGVGTVTGKCTVTFTSPSAGKVTGTASVDLIVFGVSLTRDTDPATVSIGSGPGGSGPGTKTFVDASISIKGNGTSDAGATRTFFVTVKRDTGQGKGLVAVPNGTKPTVTLTSAKGAAPSLQSNGCATTGTVAGKCTVTYTSLSGGTVFGNASVTLNIGGVTVTRDTDPVTPTPAGPGGTTRAISHFMGGSIALSPTSLTSEVSVARYVQVTLERDQGDGSGLVNVPNGTKVTVTMTNSNGATGQVVEDDCSTTGTSSGQCAFWYTSDTAGQVTVNASATFPSGALSLTRDTDPATASIGSGPGGTGPSTFTWVDASVKVTQSTAAAEVNTGHTVTVQVKQDAGGGAGLVNVTDGNTPTVTLTVAHSAVSQTDSNGCLSTGTVSGQCAITFRSTHAGQITVNVTAQIVVGGVTMYRSTDATSGWVPGPGGSGPVVTSFVDASIALNPLGQSVPHPGPAFVTVWVKQDLGDGNGLVNAPAGTKPTWTFFLPELGDTCATSGLSNGQCTLGIYYSGAAGTSVDASVTFTVAGVSLTRDTTSTTPSIPSGPGGTGSAVVQFT
jgi:hypothetical protein